MERLNITIIPSPDRFVESDRFEPKNLSIVSWKLEEMDADGTIAHV